MAAQCLVDYVVFLNRAHVGPARLLPFPKDAALWWFEQVVRAGKAENGDAHKATLRRLLSAEILELRYSDLDSAIEQLEAMVGDAHLIRSALGSSVEDRENA